MSLRDSGPVRYVLEMRILLAVIAAAVLISSCGSVGTGSNPSPTPSGGPTLGFDVTVTETTRAASLAVERSSVMGPAVYGAARRRR